MDENLAQQAIDKAMSCQWDEAIDINKKILIDEKDDIDALNRLARAYFESSKLDLARKTSQRVLKIDPTNSIAIKACDKYKNIQKGKGISPVDHNIDASVFIEEPGKTKVTNLINLNSKNALELCAGDEVNISTHTHRVSITSKSGDYIGRLTDDLSARLRYLVKNGNSYKAFIKSLENKNVKVLIRESKRGKDMKNSVSFPRDASESLSEPASNSDF